MRINFEGIKALIKDDLEEAGAYFDMYNNIR